MKVGQAVIGVAAGAIFAACAAMAALGQPPESHRAEYSTKASRPKNTGNPAAGAFLIDFSKGFDWRTQYLSNHDIENSWNHMIYRPANVGFDAQGMTLSAVRDSGHDMPYTMSEFKRAGYYGYGRYEVVMRAAPGDGVVSSFFIYTGPHFGDPHNEIDFEFLGRNPSMAHLNYFSDNANAPLNVELGFDATEGEHLYAFEWMPDSITWYVDGRLLRRVTSDASTIPLPTASSIVMASVWVGNGETTAWVGEPSVDESHALYRCMSHVPAGKSGKQCSNVFPSLIDAATVR